MDVCVVTYRNDVEQIRRRLRAHDRLLVWDNTERNIGFAAGANAAAELGADPLIAFVNPDGDPSSDCFAALESHIPALFQDKSSTGALRVWVAGCATGEEAYSIAMLLLEELQAGRKGVPLQVFASDVDPGALDFARVGLYPESVVREVSPERRRRFFLEEDHSARVSKELREGLHSGALQ